MLVVKEVSVVDGVEAKRVALDAGIAPSLLNAVRRLGTIRFVPIDGNAEAATEVDGAILVLFVVCCVCVCELNDNDPDIMDWRTAVVVTVTDVVCVWVTVTCTVVGTHVFPMSDPFKESPESIKQ